MSGRTKPKITFVDLFAGIGGFHLGVCKAAKKKGVGAKCVLAVDIDRKARTTYLNYFKNTNFLHDVTNPLVKKEVPKGVDIICGGFPCQPFSLAGKKLGIEDDRGTLFEHIVEILQIAKPKAVFLENVRNLLSIKNRDGSKVIDHITGALEEAGYPVVIKPYKASQFGLPTHRPRVYLVGFRKDILDINDFPWPDPTDQKAPTLAEFFKKLEWEGVKRNGWPNRVGNTIRVGGMGSGFRIRKDGSLRRDKRNWDSYMFYENDKDGSVRKKPHELTVDEAKAMMGFPENFSFGELSRPQAMKQLGNSVAIPVIQAIAECIIDVIHDRSYNK